MSNEKVPVLIVESSRLLGELLVEALNARSRFHATVMRQADDVNGLVATLRSTNTFVLVLDLDPLLASPGASERAIRLIAELRAAIPLLCIVATSNAHQACFVSALIRATADCHVVKRTATMSMMVTALDVALARGLYLCDESKALLRRAAEGPQLTARQLQIVRLAAASHSAGDIAVRLQVSRGTIGRHFTNMAARLEVTTMNEVVGRACQLGLVD